MDIVVLAGGLSPERDVSFVSGNMVSCALRKTGHRVILLDVFMGYSDKPEELEGIFDRAEEISAVVSEIPTEAPDLEAVKRSRKDQSECLFGPNVIPLCQMADIVFMALHGESGENGKIQAAFDLFGIKYTGSDYLSCALAMNKELAKGLFRACNIPTPEGISMKREAKMTRFADTGLTLPCVVKPCCGGSSIGVSVVRSEAEYEKALEEAFRYEPEILVETYIEGREFSVAVIDGEAYPVIEIAPLEGFYDYKNKYKAGSTVETCPAKLPEEIARKMQEYAKQAVKALGLCTYSRMDFLLNEKQELFCLEANTLPGMTPTSLVPQEALAHGISFEELCEKIIRISFEKYHEGGSVDAF